MNMDEPCWSWPAWKFGMKREDITTKLHDEYNTFSSSIQDPEAFHHDVFEISHEASTPEEFHTLMAARKQQRLQELHDSLESAAFEIIAHPKLIGTEQWQYAVQLFRTRSFDSLVRYFSSYLSHGYHTPFSTQSFSEESSVTSASTCPSSVDVDDHIGNSKPLVPTYLAGECNASFSDEPEDFYDSISISLTAKIPPRSMTMRSDTDTASLPPSNDVSNGYPLRPSTPIRTLSFSGSESGSISPLRSVDDDDDGETSQSSEDDFPASSETDLSMSRSSLDSMSFPKSESSARQVKEYCDDDDEGIPATQLPLDSCPNDIDDDYETIQSPLETSESMESDMPTPKQETMTSSYMDSKCMRSFLVRSTTRQTSQQTAQPSSPQSLRLRRRERSPLQRMRSPEELFSRIQKPLPDGKRIRPKGRTRLD